MPEGCPCFNYYLELREKVDFFFIFNKKEYVNAVNNREAKSP